MRYLGNDYFINLLSGISLIANSRGATVSLFTTSDEQTKIKKATYLHATEPDAEGSGRARLALGNLLGAFLSGRVVSMLARAHL